MNDNAHEKSDEEYIESIIKAVTSVLDGARISRIPILMKVAAERLLFNTMFHPQPLQLTHKYDDSHLREE